MYDTQSGQQNNEAKNKCYYGIDNKPRGLKVNNETRQKDTNTLNQTHSFNESCFNG